MEDELRGMVNADSVTLKEKMELVLRNLEFETDLFEALLSVYPERLRAVIAAGGRATKY